MRGLVATSVALLLASLSGCVSMVEDDPDTQAAVDELDQAVADYKAKAGHIAGTVVAGTAATPLAGASVDLLGVADDLATDADGRFAFLDLAPGTYTVAVDAAGYLPQQVSLEVEAGQFSRPVVAMAEDTPPAYQQVFRFEGFQDIASIQCWCEFADELDDEGLTAIVVEAQMETAQPFLRADRFVWSFTTFDVDDDATDAGGEDEAPLYRVLAGDDLQPEARAFRMVIEPHNGFLPVTQQAFTVLVTAFYNGDVPDGYSAFAPAA